MNKWRLKNGSTITFVGDGEELKGCRSNFGMPVGDNLTDEQKKKAEWVLSNDVVSRLDILLEEVGRFIDPEVLWSEMFSSQSDRITFKDGQIHVSREDIWPV